MSELAGKRVLVTGGTGFLGMCVVEKAQIQGAIVEVLDSTTELRTDSRAEEATYGQEIVIHCAGNVGGIGKNAERPAELFYDNLMMGVNIIEACAHQNVEKLVMIGTVCSYPSEAHPPFYEDDLWDGYPEPTNAPYGIAKRALLTMCQAYRQQYGLNSIFLMPANLYGPGDHFDPRTSHVIPAMIRKFTEAVKRGERSVTLWGDGKPTREFLYVDDAAEAIVLAAEKYDGAEPVNIGTGRDISIECLARLIAEYTGFDGVILWDTSKPNGQMRRCLDTTRAVHRFAFLAGTDLEIGLRKTIEWYCVNTPK